MNLIRFLLAMLLTGYIIGCGNANKNATNNLLVGEWILDSSQVSPAYLPSFCKSLENGSRFVFDYNNALTVYPDTSAVKCNSYSYHFTGTALHLTEWDMVVEFPVTHFDSSSLVIKSTWIPYESRMNDRSLDDVHEYLMYLHRK
jgi:hypothetical protein